MLPMIAIGCYFGCVIPGSQQSLLFRMCEIINLRIVSGVIAGMYDYSDSMMVTAVIAGMYDFMHSMMVTGVIAGMYDLSDPVMVLAVIAGMYVIINS